MPTAERDKFSNAIISNKMRYFVPNGAQEEYINMVGYSLDDVKLPVVLFSSGNGVGKTLATVHIAGNLIKGPQSGWFDMPFFRNWKYPKKIWYCSTAENIKDNVVPMFRELFKDGIFEEDYEEKKDQKYYVARLLIDKWEVQFKTFDQDDKTYESSTVGLIIADEPMPESKWKACKSRRRMGCVIILPMTPLYCPPYIIDEIHDAAKRGKKGYYHAKGSVYSSCKKRGVRGHRDPQIIDEEVAGYDEEEKQARVYGDFMYLSRRILEKITRKDNVRTPEEIPIHKNAILMQVADPHDSRPFYTAWLAVNPPLEGDTRCRHIWFAEAPRDQTRPFWDFKRSETLNAEVRGWKQIEDEWLKTLGRNSNEVYRVLDRHYGWNERVVKGENTTMAEMLSSVGEKEGMTLYFAKSYSSNSEEGEINVGHKMIREQAEPLADGDSGLIFYPNLYHMMNGITHYIRKGLKGVAADEKVAADAPIVEKYKDPIDVLRYGTGTKMQPRIPQPPKPSIESWADNIDDGLPVGEETIYDMESMLE